MAKKKSPEYAKAYFEKTGVELITLINSGSKNEDIKLKFFEAGLDKPSEEYLNNFRKVSKGGKETVTFIADEFKNFLADKLGIERVTDIAILDAIILAGFLNLKKEMESGKVAGNVTVAEVLKALELKGKSFGVAPLSIGERVKSIFRGEGIPPEGKKEEEKSVPPVSPENDAFTL